MKALVGAFNQALVGAFSVIVKTGCGTDGALHRTTPLAPFMDVLCMEQQYLYSVHHNFYVNTQHFLKTSLT